MVQKLNSEGMEENTMRKIYDEPQAEVILFSSSDVITASTIEEDPNEGIE